MNDTPINEYNKQNTMKIKCQYCPKSFASPSGLSSHMRSSHPANFKPKNPGQYVRIVDRKKGKRKLSMLRPPRSGATMESPIPSPTIKYCPNCGCGLAAYHIAATL